MVLVFTDCTSSHGLALTLLLIPFTLPILGLAISKPRLCSTHEAFYSSVSFSSACVHHPTLASPTSECFLFIQVFIT